MKITWMEITIIKEDPLQRAQNNYYNDLLCHVPFGDGQEKDFELRGFINCEKWTIFIQSKLPLYFIWFLKPKFCILWRQGQLTILNCSIPRRFGKGWWLKQTVTMTSIIMLSPPPLPPSTGAFHCESDEGIYRTDLTVTTSRGLYGDFYNFVYIFQLCHFYMYLLRATFRYWYCGLNRNFTVFL